MHFHYSFLNSNIYKIKTFNDFLFKLFPLQNERFDYQLQDGILKSGFYVYPEVENNDNLFFTNFNNALQSQFESGFDLCCIISGSFGYVYGIKYEDKIDPRLFETSINDEFNEYNTQLNFDFLLHKFPKIGVIRDTNNVLYDFDEFGNCTEYNFRKNLISSDETTFDKYDYAKEHFRLNFCGSRFYPINEPDYSKFGLRIYNSYDYLNFGKFKFNTEKEVNLNIEQLFDSKPNYIFWLINNLDHFALTSEFLINSKKTIPNRTKLINCRKVDYLNRIEYEFNKRRNDNSQRRDENRDIYRDAFYALTDGNYGSWEEFDGY